MADPELRGQADHPLILRVVGIMVTGSMQLSSQLPQRPGAEISRNAPPCLACSYVIYSLGCILFLGNALHALAKHD